MTDYTYHKGSDVAAIEINADGTQRVIPRMTYDVQRYCFCWVCEAMVQWNEPCHEETVTNASYGAWVRASDAEAHEKAAMEAARIEWGEHIGRTQIRHVDDEPQRVREQAILDCIAAVRRADVAGFRGFECQEIIEADLRALLEGEK